MRTSFHHSLERHNVIELLLCLGMPLIFVVLRLWAPSSGVGGADGVRDIVFIPVDLESEVVGKSVEEENLHTLDLAAVLEDGLRYDVV